jgi:2-hydroxy-3-keto-5-methylthiopentenyl-1-phosphate phosphatase
MSEFDPANLKENDALRVEFYQAQLASFRTFVADESNYAPDTSITIKQRYEQADRISGGESLDVRIARRLSQFPKGISVKTDVDGTLTKDPSDYLEKLIPGSMVAEPLLARYSRTSFPAVFSSTWFGLLDKSPDVFFSAGTQVPLREGVPEFFEWATPEIASVSVVSANFEPFVEGVMSQIPKAETVNLRAVNQWSVVVTDKGTLLTHLAKRSPDRAQFYIGDGTSDLEAITACEFIACYFALEGSSFAKALDEASLPYYTYRDFYDVKAKLEQLLEMRDQSDYTKGVIFQAPKGDTQNHQASL